MEIVNISVISTLTQCHFAKQIPPHSCNTTAVGLQETCLFQHNEVIPFIFVCLALPVRVVSLHLFILKVSWIRWVFISAPFVALLLGLPWAYLMSSEVFFSQCLYHSVILFSFCLCSSHTDKSLVSTHRWHHEWEVADWGFNCWGVS